MVEDIRVNVATEGTEDIADGVAAPDDGGGMGGQQQGGGMGGLGAIGGKLGAIVGLLGGVLAVLASLESVQTILSTIGAIFEALLAPLAITLLRLFEPVLRQLFNLMPLLMRFYSDPVGVIQDALSQLGEFAVENPAKALAAGTVSIAALLTGASIASFLTSTSIGGLLTSVSVGGLLSGTSIGGLLTGASVASLLSAVSVGAVFLAISAAAVFTAVSIGTLLTPVSLGEIIRNPDQNVTSTTDERGLPARPGRGGPGEGVTGTGGVEINIGGGLSAFVERITRDDTTQVTPGTGPGPG